MKTSTVPCRHEGCDHAPFKNVRAERMHFHRAHSRTIIPFRENEHAPKVRIGKKTGKPDRRTKAWRALHPRLAKPLGGRGVARRSVLDRAIAHFAGPAVTLECPQCHYDFTLLTSSKVPNKVCPGCATPLQTFIDRLTAIAHA